MANEQQRPNQQAVGQQTTLSTPAAGLSAGSAVAAPAPAIGSVQALGPRERILEAALQLFVEQGYFNTNVPDISRQSKCSVGSIYHHFLNKEEIASELYRIGMRKFRDALSDGISDNASLEKTIKTVVTRFLEFSESSYLWSKYLWLARHNEFLAGELTRPTTVGFDNLGRKLTKAIKAGMRKKEIAVLNAEVIWTVIFGLPLSFIRDWLDGYTSQKPSQIAPILAEASWAALKGIKGN